MIDMPDSDRLAQHEGHRQRLKKRFLKEGFEYFEPHNILEMALFYTSPRQDTNGLAHRLIDSFGSFAAVCDAPFEELCAIPGVGEETAIFLKMLPEFSRMYNQSRQSPEIMITDPETAIRFFWPRFIGRTNEVFIAAFLNGRGEVLFVDVLAEGDANNVVMDSSAVVRRALTVNAAAVVVAHNHPHGFAVPSQQDIIMTERLAAALGLINVQLCDHIIFSQGDCIRMSRCQTSSQKTYFAFS